MRTFELMFGFIWWAICHTAYKDSSCVQVDSCCILFEYSVMHAHEGTSSTCVLTQNVPAREKEVLRILTELNVVEIAHISGVRITTRVFPSSSNRAVP